MNAVHVYDYDDAPHSLREECRSMIPAGYDPRWLAYAERQSKSPTYVLAFASSAWIGAMSEGEHKVFLRETSGGGEVRVGCARKR